MGDDEVSMPGRAGATAKLRCSYRPWVIAVDLGVNIGEASDANADGNAQRFCAQSQAASRVDVPNPKGSLDAF